MSHQQGLALYAICFFFFFLDFTLKKKKITHSADHSNLTILTIYFLFGSFYFSVE